MTSDDVAQACQALEAAGQTPSGTYGREPVIRPHFGVLSAVSYAVLEFRTGNPS